VSLSKRLLLLVLPLALLGAGAVGIFTYDNDALGVDTQIFPGYAGLTLQGTGNFTINFNSGGKTYRWTNSSPLPVDVNARGTLLASPVLKVDGTTMTCGAPSMGSSGSVQLARRIVTVSSCTAAGVTASLSITCEQDGLCGVFLSLAGTATSVDLVFTVKDANAHLKTLHWDAFNFSNGATDIRRQGRAIDLSNDSTVWANGKFINALELVDGERAFYLSFDQCPGCVFGTNPTVVSQAGGAAGGDVTVTQHLLAYGTPTAFTTRTIAFSFGATPVKDLAPSWRTVLRQTSPNGVGSSACQSGTLAANPRGQIAGFWLNVLCAEDLPFAGPCDGLGNDDPAWPSTQAHYQCYGGAPQAALDLQSFASATPPVYRLPYWSSGMVSAFDPTTKRHRLAWEIQPAIHMVLADGSWPAQNGWLASMNNQDFQNYQLARLTEILAALPAQGVYLDQHQVIDSLDDASAWIDSAGKRQPGLDAGMRRSWLKRVRTLLVNSQRQAYIMAHDSNSELTPSSSFASVHVNGEQFRNALTLPTPDLFTDYSIDAFRTHFATSEWEGIPNSLIVNYPSGFNAAAQREFEAYAYLTDTQFLIQTPIVEADYYASRDFLDLWGWGQSDAVFVGPWKVGSEAVCSANCLLGYYQRTISHEIVLIVANTGTTGTKTVTLDQTALALGTASCTAQPGGAAVTNSSGVLTTPSIPSKDYVLIKCVPGTAPPPAAFTMSGGPFSHTIASAGTAIAADAWTLAFSSTTALVSFSCNQTWIAPSPTSASVAGPIALQYNTAGLPVGASSATCTASCPTCATPQTATVNATVTVSAPPTFNLTVTPAGGFTHTITQGGSIAADAFNVAITGGTPVWTASIINDETPSVVQTNSSGNGSGPGSASYANAASLATGAHTGSGGTLAIHVHCAACTPVNVDLPVSVTVTSAGGGLTASFVPSRASCFAPCFWYADASGTSGAGLTSNISRDFDFSWVFDDAVAAGKTWGNGARAGGSSPLSKNVERGYVVGHIFEQAGTFAVQLTVRAPNGAVAQSTQNVTVSAWSETTNGPTYCFSAGGTFPADSTLCGTSGPLPSGQRVTQSNLGAAVQTCTNTGARHARCLFRGGDTFTNTGGANVKVGSASTGTIISGGADYGFGTGKALSTGGVQLQTGEVVADIDWNNGAGGIPNVNLQFMLLWKNACHDAPTNTGGCFGGDIGLYSGYVENSATNMGFYCWGDWLQENGAALGNHLGPNCSIGTFGTGHVYRNAWPNHMAIAHNSTIANGNLYTSYDLNATDHPNGTFTEYLYFYDNDMAINIAGDPGGVKSDGLAAGPQYVNVGAGQGGEPWRYAVFESNFCHNAGVPGEQTIGRTCIGLKNCQWCTIRNNVAEQTDTGNGMINVQEYAGTPSGHDQLVIGNTAWNPNGGGCTQSPFTNQPTQLNNVFRDNLSYQNAGSCSVVNCAGNATCVQDHNLRALTKPFATSASIPTKQDDAKLSGSAATVIDQGITDPGMQRDAFGTQRPLGTNDDIGAHEKQ
jgi:hypothetical protein